MIPRTKAFNRTAPIFLVLGQIYLVEPRNDGAISNHFLESVFLGSNRVFQVSWGLLLFFRKLATQLHQKTLSHNRTPTQCCIITNITALLSILIGDFCFFEIVIIRFGLLCGWYPHAVNPIRIRRSVCKFLDINSETMLWYLLQQQVRRCLNGFKLSVIAFV